jgi:hemerythrin-like domain-containing protein
MTAARTQRPQRPPAPPLPSFDRLDSTHRAALEMLGAFERLLDRLEEHGLDDEARRAAREVLAFFAGPGRDHHAEEERVVFPGLLAAGDPELVQHVRRLQQDHGWIEEDWLELAPQVDAIANGYNWYDLPMLRLAVPVFSALYHEHIALEEAVVYPAAKQHLEALRQGEGARGSASAG